MSKRDDYVEALKKHVDVDIYGKCGNMGTVCPRAKNPAVDECLKSVSLKYKFYLAFENSICEEYITEKMQRTLDFPVVPIVMGAGPYERYFPRGSYISVFDFESPKHLADYIHFLDQNPVSCTKPIA